MFLVVTNVSKSYGIQPVLKDVSFTLSAGERIGLVGANGVGKSTLIKIITGQIEADGGSVSLSGAPRVGYLSQVMVESGDSVQSLIEQALAELHTLEAKMRDLESHMTHSAPDLLPSILDQYASVSEQFERQGGYEVDHRVESLLSGLHVEHIERARRIETLSGGEQARLALALLLLHAPDVLLLDEPTNHLDFRSLAWLEAYLQAYRGSMLIVSHDRQFLNRTVNKILELDEYSHEARRYSGNYDAYLEAKLNERRAWEEDYQRQQEEMAALRHEIKVSARQVSHNRANNKAGGDKFAKGFFRGRVETTVAHRVQTAEEKLRRLEESSVPKPPAPLRFDPDFDPEALKAHSPLIAAHLDKAFGSRCVLSDISFTLDTRSRIALVGPNGAGKSTLLKILAGLCAADSGEIMVNPQVKIGYLDQGEMLLDPGQTLLEAYRAGLPANEQQAISDLLATGLFRYEEIRRQVQMLSSGQKRKLQIARLIADRANLLLLDEPTNHVSLDILEAFESALQNFPGPIIAVSHDRRFLQAMGGELWELSDSRLIRYGENAAELSEIGTWVV